MMQLQHARSSLAAGALVAAAMALAVSGTACAQPLNVCAGRNHLQPGSQGGFTLRPGHRLAIRYQPTQDLALERIELWWVGGAQAAFPVSQIRLKIRKQSTQSVQPANEVLMEAPLSGSRIDAWLGADLPAPFRMEFGELYYIEIVNPIASYPFTVGRQDVPAGPHDTFYLFDFNRGAGLEVQTFPIRFKLRFLSRSCNSTSDGGVIPAAPGCVGTFSDVPRLTLDGVPTPGRSLAWTLTDPTRQAETYDLWFGLPARGNGFPLPSGCIVPLDASSVLLFLQTGVNPLSIGAFDPSGRAAGSFSLPNDLSFVGSSFSLLARIGAAPTPTRPLNEATSNAFIMRVGF